MVRVKVTVQVVIFFVFFNAFAGALVSAGYWDGSGLEPSVESPDELDTAEDDMRSVEASGGGLGTLFGLWTRLATFVRVIHDALLPGMAMLNDVGVPVLVTGMFSGVIGFMAGRDLITFLRSG